MQINIIYWSGTGNTKRMAELICEGAESAGASVSVSEVVDVDIDAALDADVIALGCSASGAEELEEYEFEPFMTSIEEELRGKKLALFGSYSWGEGEWMRIWSERIKNAGAQLITEDLIVYELPTGEDEKRCIAFGAALAQ